MCEICEFVDKHPAIMFVDTKDNNDNVALAYAAGFARGFTVRTVTSFTVFCEKHADMMKDGLAEAGAKPVNPFKA